MPERTLIQKLDWILQAIIDNTSNEEIVKTYDWNTNELKEILEKLAKDGYIKRIWKPHIKTYENTPTVEGRLFIGYEKQRQLDDKSLTSIGQMAIATRKYNTRLLWATWCAGIAAALLLLWQVWIWFYPIHKN